MAAREQGCRRPHEGSVVIQRPGHDVHAVPAQQEQRIRLGVDERRRVREDQLRSPRGAARRHRLPRIGGRVRQRLVTEAVDVERRVDHDLRLRELDDRGQLADRQPRGHWLRRRAELPACDDCREELDAVGQGDRHEIARRHAAACKCPRRPRSETIELHARHRAALVGHARAIGIRRGESGESFGIRNERHSRRVCQLRGRRAAARRESNAVKAYSRTTASGSAGEPRCRRSLAFNARKLAASSSQPQQRSMCAATAREVSTSHSPST